MSAAAGGQILEGKQGHGLGNKDTYCLMSGCVTEMLVEALTMHFRPGLRVPSSQSGLGEVA